MGIFIILQEKVRAKNEFSIIECQNHERRMKNQSLYISLRLNMERKPKENEENVVRRTEVLIVECGHFA